MMSFMQLSTSTLHHIPANALPAFASTSSCLKLCILSFMITPWRPGSNCYYCLNVACHQPSARVDIKSQLTSKCFACDLWSRGQFGILWRLALCHSKVGSATRRCSKSRRPWLEYALSLACSRWPLFQSMPSTYIFRYSIKHT